MDYQSRIQSDLEIQCVKYAISIIHRGIYFIYYILYVQYINYYRHFFIHLNFYSSSR